MKRKTALTVVIAAILLVTMLLSSCGGSIKHIKSY